jgi:GT2 family glycosyltransferase
VKTPFISTFVVNYNTCALLEQCLKSIFDTTGNLNIEVFVADNNSIDGSPEMVEARFPEVLLFRYPKNMGYTKAINPMLRLGKGEYYLLLHPDLVILPETLEQFVEFFESNPQAGILGANLYYPDGTPNPSEILFPSFKNELLCLALRLFKRLPGGRKLAGNYNPVEWSRKATSRVNWVWNACMIVRRQVFDRVGYFDEDFYVWYADWDLCKRAADGGWSVYYLHAATAIHYERQSFARQHIIREEIRYKIDGWYSAPRQIQDRHVFLRKHSSPGATAGVKGLYIVENVLRLWLILGGLLLRRTTSEEVAFQLKACLQTIQAIHKA